MQDPTREELDAMLAAFPFISEADVFDKEEAIYWLASDWHGGQGSNLYSVLSASEFRPGPFQTGPSGGMAFELFSHLVATIFDQQPEEA